MKPSGEIPRQMVTARAFTPLQSSVTRFRFFRVGTCLLDAAGCRSQPFADVRSTTVVKAEWQKWSLLEVSNVAQRRFVWQAWHFVTVQQLEMCFPQQRRTFCSTSEHFKKWSKIFWLHCTWHMFQRVTC
jgi:hypothetical protein